MSKTYTVTLIFQSLDGRLSFDEVARGLPFKTACQRARQEAAVTKSEKYGPSSIAFVGAITTAVVSWQ